MLLNKFIIAFSLIFLIYSNKIYSEKTLKAQYNLTQSKQNAKFSALAFCGRTCIQNWNCHASIELPFLSPTHISDNLTLAAGYIGYRPDTKTIVTSWRGSDNRRNWYQDFNFQMIPFKRCKDCHIHAGFYGDFLLLQPKVFQKIDNLISKYQVKRFVSTGHSLGGALSLITGLQIKLRYGNKFQVQVHNFGQPRIGDANLAQFVNSKLDGIFRVIHNQDLVPHVPFQFIKYVHTPNQIFFDLQMKNYKICNDSGQDPTCSNKFFPNYNPHDHDFYFIEMPNEGTNCKVTVQNSFQ